jgi:hypothetical protein
MRLAAHMSIRLAAWFASRLVWNRRSPTASFSDLKEAVDVELFMLTPNPNEIDNSASRST